MLFVSTFCLPPHCCIKPELRAVQGEMCALILCLLFGLEDTADQEIHLPSEMKLKWQDRWQDINRWRNPTKPWTREGRGECWMLKRGGTTGRCGDGLRAVVLARVRLKPRRVSGHRDGRSSRGQEWGMKRPQRISAHRKAPQSLVHVNPQMGIFLNSPRIERFFYKNLAAYMQLSIFLVLFLLLIVFIYRNLHLLLNFLKSRLCII